MDHGPPSTDDKTYVEDANHSFLSSQYVTCSENMNMLVLYSVEVCFMSTER